MLNLGDLIVQISIERVIFMKVKLDLLMVLALISLSGCATAFNRPTDVRVDVRNVTEARVSLNGKPAGTTPAVVTLDPGQRYVLKIEKEGFKTLSTNLAPRFGTKGAAMIVLNASTVVASPLAPVAAFGTDLASGTGYKTYPKVIEFVMTPSVNVPASTLSSTTTPQPSSSPSPPPPAFSSQEKTGFSGLPLTGTY